MTHADYMQRAMMLALKAQGQTSPNPMVGAIIVKGRRIIAEGWHARCGADHAEVVALKKAGSRARGCRMYVTLEPCHHTGRTPPCVDQIIESGVKEVFIGMKDPNPLTNGRSIAKLRRMGIKATVGFLQDELRDMNEPFIKFIRKRLPFVAAKCAQTLDGKIATASGRSKWITSAAARQYAKKVRGDFDAIMVGVNTVLSDNPRLNPGGAKRRNFKVIVDSALRTPLTAKLFTGVRVGNCMIAVTQRAPLRKRVAFTQKGVKILVCPQSKGQVDLRWLFKELVKREITSVLIEGGAHLIGSALKAKVVDKMFIYIAPKILGDQNALSAVVGLGALTLDQAQRLKKIKTQSIGKDILVTGYV